MRSNIKRLVGEAGCEQVFLEGTYGIGNFGDDLLGVFFKRKLEAMGFRVIVCGNQKLNRNTEIGKIDVHRVDIISKVRALYRSKFVVIGGGGQFNDNSSFTGGLHLLITFLICIFFRKKIFVCGTGFGPLKSNFSRMVWSILGRYKLSYFALRELGGKQLFDSLTGRSAVLVADPIFSEPFRQDIFKDYKGTLVGSEKPLALLNFRRFRRSKKIEKIIVGRLADEYQIEGLSVDDGDDLSGADLEKYGVLERHGYLGVSATVAMISKASLVVTQRFHVLCLCVLLGKPVIPVVYANKMKDFCLLIGLRYISVRDCDEEKILSTMESLLAEAPKNFGSCASRADAIAWLDREINSI